MRILFWLLFSCLAPFAAQAETPPATMALYTGDCFVWHSGKSDEAELGQALFPGDSVRTGKDSRAELAFSDGTTLRLAENSRLYIQQADTVRSFKLLWGKIWSKVAKLADTGVRFQVETPTAVAGVRGTVFRVEIGPDSTSRVAVEEGEVDVYQPRLARRIVRLAALREAFVRRNAEPGEPRSFDLSREDRWERWSKLMFLRLVKTLRGTISGLERQVKDEEMLAESARKLQQKAAKKGKVGQGLGPQVAALRKKAVENQRQWQLLFRRCQRRLHQLQVLSGRVEDEADLPALAGQADEVRSHLDALAARFQTAEALLLPLIEQLEQQSDDMPDTGQLDAETIRTRLAKMKSTAENLASVASELEPELQAVSGKLAEFLQGLNQVKQELSQHPLAAREHFWRIRGEYFTYKQQHHGFDYPSVEKNWPELRTIANQCRQTLRQLPRDDTRRADTEETVRTILQNGERLARLAQAVKKVDLQSMALERLFVEISGLIKK